MDVTGKGLCLSSVASLRSVMHKWCYYRLPFHSLNKNRKGGISEDPSHSLFYGDSRTGRLPRWKKEIGDAVGKRLNYYKVRVHLTRGKLFRRSLLSLESDSKLGKREMKVSLFVVRKQAPPLSLSLSFSSNISSLDSRLFNSETFPVINYSRKDFGWKGRYNLVNCCFSASVLRLYYRAFPKVLRASNQRLRWAWKGKNRNWDCSTRFDL